MTLENQEQSGWVHVPMKYENDKWFIWYKDCERHDDHNPGCPKCNSGKWIEIEKKEMNEEPTDKCCANCNWIRWKMKFNLPRYFCRHKGCITDPNRKICGCWKEQDANYSRQETIADYQGDKA
jgi:hypothetical protein